MLVEGRHFLSTVAPQRLGHKALAVNLSDLAACGARPLAFTLALALPRADEAFLAPFARGLFALADAHGIELVGGDTTAGPLTIVHHRLRRGAGRAGAAAATAPRAGDGSGSAARWATRGWRWRSFAAALALPGDDFDGVRRAMELPQPRVALGQALRGVAHERDRPQRRPARRPRPCAARFARRRGGRGRCHPAQRDRWPRPATMLQRGCVLHGGDDYELLFSAPPERDDAVRAAAAAAGVRGDADRPHGGRTRAARARRARARAGRRGTRLRPLRRPGAAGRGLNRNPRMTARQLRLHAPPPGALAGAGFRQRPVAACAGHGRHAVGLGRLPGARPLARRPPAGRCCLLVGFGLGWWACTRTAQHLGVGRPGRHRLGRDHRLLARAVAVWTPAGWWAQAAAFGLFRFFDAVKPRRRWAGPTARFKLRPGQRSAGARVSASCSTTWWLPCAPCSCSRCGRRYGTEAVRGAGVRARRRAARTRLAHGRRRELHRRR